MIKSKDDESYDHQQRRKRRSKKHDIKIVDGIFSDLVRVIIYHTAKPRHSLL